MDFAAVRLPRPAPPCRALLAQRRPGPRLPAARMKGWHAVIAAVVAMLLVATWVVHSRPRPEAQDAPEPAYPQERVSLHRV